MSARRLLAAFLLSIALCFIPVLGYETVIAGESEKYLRIKMLYDIGYDRRGAARDLCVISLAKEELEKLAEASLKKEENKKYSVTDIVIDADKLEKFREYRKEKAGQGRNQGPLSCPLSYKELLELVLRIKYADRYEVVGIVEDKYIILAIPSKYYETPAEPGKWYTLPE